MGLRTASSLILSLLTLRALADSVDTSISFGQNGGALAQDGRIPGWRLQGDPSPPKIVKDRIVLTPPYPGSQRGAAWAEERVTSDEFTADIEFRATGPERGGGNLQIWYVKESQAVGLSSIYTVNKFDGLALMVDAYGGRGGSIRGFLNDGSTDFKDHYGVDPLAFGNCKYPYRNLGFFSKLQIKQSKSGFEVNIDGKECIKTDQVKLPANNYMGISAASAEWPDSFEVTKFAISKPPGATANSNYESNTNQQAGSVPNSGAQTQQQNFGQPQIQLSTAELESKLQRVTDKFDALQRDIDRILSMQESTLSRISERSKAVDDNLDAIRKDLAGKDMQELRRSVENLMSDTHNTLLEYIPQSMNKALTTNGPRVWFLVSLFALLQIALAGSYFVYKSRRANSPKKLL